MDETLLTLFDQWHPEPVDVFENRLAAKLSLVPHPAVSVDDWRRVRVMGIRAAGELADSMALEVERELETEAVGRETHQ